MAQDPPADLELTTISGVSRPLHQWVTNFHLVAVVIDPYTAESAALLDVAGRVLTHFDQADCRVAWLVTADAGDARLFLGPWAEEVLTFCDPGRDVVRALGLAELPAIVHIDTAGHLVGAAEGWRPPEWRAVTDRLARLMSWTPVTLGGPRDPAPFDGSPALG